MTYDREGFLNGGPGIFMFCSDRELTYEPVFLEWRHGEADPNPIEERVAPGDRVIMTVVRDARAGRATYTMENLTRGWSASYRDRFVGGFENATVEMGDARMALDGHPVPPPEFGRAALRHVRLDGADLSESGSHKVQLVDGDGLVLERATKWRSRFPDQRFTLINKD